MAIGLVTIKSPELATNVADTKYYSHSQYTRHNFLQSVIRCDHRRNTLFSVGEKVGLKAYLFQNKDVECGSIFEDQV